jgi:hypothetical protein
MNEIDVLKDVIQKLTNNNIKYMLSGSLSMSFYTMPRMTRDIDIVIQLTNNEIEKMFDIFKNEYYIDKEIIYDAVKNFSMFNIIHTASVTKIDFIIRKNEEYRILEFENRKKVFLDDIEINIVSLEDLVISKIYWSKDSLSELQIRDVKNLIKKNYDKNYVEHWCKKLEIFSLYEKIISEK